MKTWLLLVVVAVAGFVSSHVKAQELSLQESALEQRLEALDKERGSPWFIEPHRPSYILPVSYIDSPSLGTTVADPVDQQADEDLQKVEVKFQFSFRMALGRDLVADNGSLYFAYSQVSVWQAYNGDQSSPFRDTNYEPEMFMAFDTDYEVFGLKGRLLSIGAVHQSNGRGSEDLSRSWNRLYANVVLERGNFACVIKPWYRIPENDEDDNNPNIDDYLGYGELRLAYKWKQHVFASMFRYNMEFDRDSRGAMELNWSFPLVQQIKGYVQYFNGYGETLLTYNEQNQRIGIGFLLADWL